MKNVVVNAIAAAYIVPPGLRVRLLRLVGISVGSGTVVKSRCTFAGPGPITIGSNCYLNHEGMFDATGEIVVGDNVYVGQGVTVGTCSHEIGDRTRRAGPRYTSPVKIGAGTWVGIGAIILPGTTVGPGCVIAAGAVVTSDCGPDGLYAGVPARLVRPLDAVAAGGADGRSDLVPVEEALTQPGP